MVNGWRVSIVGANGRGQSWWAGGSEKTGALCTLLWDLHLLLEVNENH